MKHGRISFIISLPQRCGLEETAEVVCIGGRKHALCAKRTVLEGTEVMDGGGKKFMDPGIWSKYLQAAGKAEEVEGTRRGTSNGGTMQSI